MDEKVMQSFQITKDEQAALKELADRTGINTSELLRKLVFGQLDRDNLQWCSKYAKSKNVDIWTWVNIVLRTFKKRCLTASYKKEFEHLVLSKN